MDSEGRYIICKLKVDDQKILLCNCYAPNEDNVEYFKQVVAELEREISDVELCIWRGFQQATYRK